jgi:[pyruvate, water dikinase]-phosphate phosphotransferase / [pyruvate, water dikinase] kinase
VDVTQTFHLHLVSDATGESAHGVARACVAQFADTTAEEHLWPMVRSVAELEMVLRGIRENPGPVIFTILNERIRIALEEECRGLSVPCISLLDTVMKELGGYLGKEIRGQPGRQYALNDEYFQRIDAMNFSMAHDDGQAVETLDQADVVLVGVSRTSKTPTAMYLANHWGVKTANIPIVPDIPLPPTLLALKGPLVIGLTTAPDRLVQIRRNRLLMLNQDDATDYIDMEKVKYEIIQARRLFARQGWTAIDVTRRSVEEIAAAIYQRFAAQRSAAGSESD